MCVVERTKIYCPLFQKEASRKFDKQQKMEDSLMDLYRKASNPMRTNKQNIRLADTPFVRDDVKSKRSSRSRGRSSTPSRRSSVSSRESRRSRRSRQPSERNFRKKSAGSTHFNEPPAFFESVRPSPTRLSEQQRSRLQVEKTREKQVLLHELSRMQMSGSQLCRDLSMEDNLADIEYELNRTKAKDDCVSTVAFMKDAIKFGVTGIEMVNSKFKVLKLNGWSSEATRDMNRYDRSLTKLYTRYMRKGSVSPILELGFLLFGSMILCHMKNSFMGGMMGGASPAATQASQPPPRQPPPPSRNVPFNRPAAAPAAATPAAAPRRTMRRPNTSNTPSMRPTMRRPNTTPAAHPVMGPLSSLNIPQQQIATAVTPPPVHAGPPAVAVMMMGRMMPPRQMTEVLSEAGSELSFAEVDIDEKRQKADAIDEIDASSQFSESVNRNVAEENDSDGESMRF